MRLNARTWSIISILLFASAFLCWQCAEKRAEKRLQGNPVKPISSHVSKDHLFGPVAGAKTQAATPAATEADAKTNLLAYRVKNTSKTLRELQRSDRAILLRNAMLDTTVPANLGIPDSLRSKGAPGSYIVQSTKPLDSGFYDSLRKAGAEFVSYVPNNAALVKASEAAAQQLAGEGNTVLPYEPYYKLDLSLLPIAMGKGQLGTNNQFSVTAFPQGRDAVAEAAQSMGGKIVLEDKTPFGPEIVIDLPASEPTDRLIQLAQNAAVQEIEPFAGRVILNDLTREFMGVSPDTVSTGSDWFGLSGTNVVVNVNDSGIDAEHPDLVDRILGLTNDWDGHGTHVAGIIAADGSQSSTVIQADGSIIPGANFRGKAPGAKIFSQGVDLLTGPVLSDTYLQTNAASQTNCLISNNSWGYRGLKSYSMASARYDAATRDALPEQTGSQPLMFVFAAGNSGSGASDGTGGSSDSILSPGTAKNVITVGALESYRNITNEVVFPSDTNGVQYWLEYTDDPTQVASYSSRGNVGMEIEGEFGRYKPDVVAPGTFIVSTRMTNYVDPTDSVTYFFFHSENEVVKPGQTNIYYDRLIDSSIEMVVRLWPNEQSPNPFPDMPIYADTNAQPTTLRGSNFVTFPVSEGNWYVGVKNPYPHPIYYDISGYVVVTNAMGNYFDVLSNMNCKLGPFYRYESGTSMAAPAVSGVLALMQEFFYTKTTNQHPSPALMKAFLINGSRRTSSLYDYNVRNPGCNFAGWGAPDIRNILPASFGSSNNPVWYVDQSLTNSLATGESRTWNMTTDPASREGTLRITLVWTDPPGNPAVGIKLVNDLDLVVTNLDTGEVFVGNNFASGDTATQPTIDDANSDVINNVENVYIAGLAAPLGTNYSITVRAKRVNVNAVTAEPERLVQDFALIVSSSSVEAPTAPFTMEDAVPDVNTNAWVMTLTNGMPLLWQRVGANTPLLGTTNGVTNQWRFFVYTNTPALTNANYTNVAFVTFLPPDLSVPRVTDADIDLYVSRDSDLTNLVTAVMNAASRSTNRGGTEAVVFTNSFGGEVYYVGVKSEDQQAAEFGIVGVATDKPFGQRDGNGNLNANILTSFPLDVPTGTPRTPGTAYMVAYSIDMQEPGSKIRRVIVTNTIPHEFRGDLGATMMYNRESVIIHSHSGSNLVDTIVYDDSEEGDVEAPLGAKVSRTDGPTSLRQYVGERTSGAWLVRYIDNGFGHGGSVSNLSICIEPKPETNSFQRKIAANGWYFDFLDVEPDWTNLNIAVTYVSGTGPVDMFLRKWDFPDDSTYDKAQRDIGAPGGSINLGTSDNPPISEGRWYWAIHNRSGASVTLNIHITFDRSLTPNLTQKLGSGTNAVPIFDQRTITSRLLVTNTSPLIAVQAGVRIDHPRISDLVLHLVSPIGTRVLLFEDRGMTNATTLGMGTFTNDNVIYTVFTEDTNLTSEFIKFATPPYAQFIGNTTRVTNWTEGFELIQATNYTGPTNFGSWTVVTNQVTVVSNAAQAFSGTNYLALADGVVTRVLPTTKGRSYVLTHNYRGAAITNWWPADGKINDLISTNHGTNSGGLVYTTGRSDKGFSFDGVDDEITFEPTVGNFYTNDFTIDFWLRSTSTAESESIMSKRADCPWGSGFSMYIGAGGVQGLFCVDISGTGAFDIEGCSSLVPLNDGVWHHIAAQRAGTLLALYVDGILTNGVDGGLFGGSVFNVDNDDILHVGRGKCDSITGMTPYSGQLDELSFFNRALSPAEIGAIYRAGSAGKYSSGSVLPNAWIMVAGSTNQLVCNSSTWLTNSIGFTAEEDNTVLQIVGNPLSLLLDNFQLVELPNTNYANYFMPEESLEAFKGENPYGYWTLEVTDTRTNLNTGVTNGWLLGWNLEMTFSATNVDLTVLTNAVAYTNRLPANSIQYFAVDVPYYVSYATNLLISYNPGDPLDLLFDQDALPTGDLPGDVTLMYNVTAAYTVLSKTGTPPFLQPGRRYFLGVRNPNNNPQDFLLRVDFDVSTNNIVITPLINTVPINTNITATTSNLDYYSFDVGPDIASVSFDILSPSGDVDMLVSHDLPLPSRLFFDYMSAEEGTMNESVVILTNSVPVPLSAGRWYIAVYNYAGTNAIDYTIRATAVGTNGIIVVPLQNAVLLEDRTAAPGSGANVFYSFAVSNNSAGVEFVVTNAQGDVDLLSKRDAFPTPGSFDAGGFNTGIAPEQIIIVTNTTLPSINGTWYLAVPNNETTNVTFAIRATLLSVTNNPLPLEITQVSAPSATNGFTFTWTSFPGVNYGIDFAADLPDAVVWSLMTNVVANTTNTTYTDQTPMGTVPARYFRVRVGP